MEAVALSAESSAGGRPGGQRCAVYTPRSPLRQPLSLVGEILRDIWRNRELTWILFQRDMKSQFRQSLLGYFWLVIPPLVAALVWYGLHAQNMINVSTGEIPYPAFVLIGSTLWAAFAATLTAPSETIVLNREVFIKLNVPIESFILAGSGRAVFNLVISCAVIIPLLLLQRVSLHWTAIFFPISALAFLTMAFAIGMCLAPIGALYTDFRNVLTPLLSLLMFTTPVVFPVPSDPGVMASVMRNNPLTPALSLARDNLVSGRYEWLAGTVVWFVISLSVLLLAFVGLRVAKPHIIARLGM